MLIRMSQGDSGILYALPGIVPRPDGACAIDSPQEKQAVRARRRDAIERRERVLAQSRRSPVRGST